METYIAALDQGTTTSRAILFNSRGEIVSKAQYPFRQIFPQPGWVEHDPMEIWATTVRALSEAVDAAITTPVLSIKNPYAGTITVPAVGEIIRDDPDAKGKIVIRQGAYEMGRKIR